MISGRTRSFMLLVCSFKWSIYVKRLHVEERLKPILIFPQITLATILSFTNMRPSWIRPNQPPIGLTFCAGGSFTGHVTFREMKDLSFGYALTLLSEETLIWVCKKVQKA